MAHRRNGSLGAGGHRPRWSCLHRVQRGAIGSVPIHRRGRLDGLPAQRTQRAALCVEFTWDGNDECDPASGRGWAQLQKDGSLRGRIYIHGGDDSGFKAIRFEEDTTSVEAAIRRKL